MKFALSWLKAFLETEASVAEISAKLNAIGLEVEGIEDPAEKLAGFRVAKVLTAARHPDADKLQVLTVDAGDGVPLQVVCGAPNARAGLVGVLGLPGAVVPAGGMTLKKALVRGVESNGMMCSVRELELGDAHEGINGNVFLAALNVTDVVVMQIGFFRQCFLTPFQIATMGANVVTQYRPIFWSCSHIISSG